MKKKVIISTSIILSVFVVWLTGSLLLDTLSIGPNPTYKFSPNYLMVHSSLYYYPDPLDWDNVDMPVQEYVSSFCLKNNWLLGKTEKAYFAINMSTHETHYPVNTVEALSKNTRIQIDTEDWVEEHKERMRSEYLFRDPSIQKIRMLVNYLFGIVLSVLFVVLLIWIFRETPREQKNI
ncbi:MAG: hypothetical protein OEV87_13235 [Phycisphaerae bacterium]|nr:hypothetical protein [Phycisphaerae bacterium]